MRNRPPGRTRATGLALLGASFIVGCIPIYLGTFSDEGDRLAIGLYMSHGSLLYRDVFTHHFPFSYFWVTAAFMLLGPTILAVRLSLLFLQLVIFALLMRVTRAIIPIGLAAMAWSAARPIYLGHLLLYTSLNSLLLAAVFVLVLAGLTDKRLMSDRVWLVLGAVAGMALLTDLSAAAPVALAFLALLFTHNGWRRALLAGAATGFMLAGFGAYLLLSGTMGDFYRDVVVFNAQVYAKFTGLTWETYVLPALTALPTGLDILRPVNWMTDISVSPYDVIGSVRQWLFGGFLERLAFIATAVTLLFQKQARAALFVYLYGAALMVRVQEYLHAAPLALVAILASAIFLARTWTIPDRVRWLFTPRSGEAAGGAVKPAGPSWRLDVRQVTPMALAFELLVWPIFLGTLLLFIHAGSYSYAYTFGPYQRLAEQLHAESCGREVALGYYPGDPTVYFFTGMKPVSKYVYLWPWVAQVAMPDLLSSLDHGEAIVQFDDKMPLAAGTKVSLYLAQLQTYLSNHYVRVGETYISPALAASCPPVAQR